MFESIYQISVASMDAILNIANTRHNCGEPACVHPLYDLVCFEVYVCEIWCFLQILRNSYRYPSLTAVL